MPLATPVARTPGPPLSRILPVLGLIPVLLCLGGAVAAAQEEGGVQSEQQIVITDRATPKIRLLVEDFLAGPGAPADDARSVHDVARNDLDLSDLFAITDIPRIAPGDTLFTGLAQGLVRGEVQVSGGNILLRGSLEALPGRSLIFSRDYRTAPENYREIAHRFADDVVRYLTGKEGIARTRIAFVSDRSGTKEIYAMDYDGHGVARVTGNKSINLSPAWSPDGSTIAFTSYQGGDADLYTVERPGGKESRLVGGPGVQSAPAYDPAGALLAYSQTAGDRSEIYVVGTDGSSPRRLSRSFGINTSPSWSPDGRRLVFTSDRAGTPQLYVMDADGTGARRLTFSGKWNDQGSWSPDGDRIAYASRRDGLFRICVMEASGLGEERQVTRGPGSDEHPRWAPDGRHVVFSSTRGGQQGLYMLNVDTGLVRPLVTVSGNNYSPDWSPVPPR